jgi:hypothetical protein
VLRIAVVGVDDDPTAAVLQADGGVDDKPLSAADAEVGVEEDDGALAVVLLAVRHCEGVVLCASGGVVVVVG